MDLLEMTQIYFGTRDLYKVLCVTKNDTSSKIHKAYKGISLILHPDHSDGSHLATEKFKVLSKVHDFLMNEDSRRIYDETGAVSVFKVSNEQYEKCRQLYQGSETERQRIRASYLSCGGNINKIMSDIPFAWADDKERITQIVEELLVQKMMPKKDIKRKFADNGKEMNAKRQKLDRAEHRTE